MRIFAILLLVPALSMAAVAAPQQTPAKAIKINPFVVGAQASPMLTSPAKRLADLLANCPACQTIATPTGVVTLVPNGQGQVMMQQKGNPFGTAPCPAGLDAAQTTAMKTKLTGLLTAQTVKALEDRAAKHSCPNLAFALTFAQIVLGDDISITKAKP